MIQTKILIRTALVCYVWYNSEPEVLLQLFESHPQLLLANINSIYSFAIINSSIIISSLANYTEVWNVSLTILLAEAVCFTFSHQVQPGLGLAAYTRLLGSLLAIFWTCYACNHSDLAGYCDWWYQVEHPQCITLDSHGSCSSLLSGKLSRSSSNRKGKWFRLLGISK